ncbi:MAG: hypothetical protein MH204_12525, partial [Fimbriimonadaceae bacterium]|nr:hypothetical protein [Fimbriimonadaceae bacterium]
KSADLRLRITPTDHPEDSDLVGTFQSAVGQLDSLESEIRRGIAMVSPGDPEGEADLDRLQARLEERAARQELGLTAADLQSGTFEEVVSHPNWAAAGMQIIFSLGWNAFTAVHMTFMIGGMWRAFGPIALALALFYAIFFAAGIGMLWSAWQAASKKTLRLDGREAELTDEVFGKVVRRKFTIAPDSKAELGRPFVSKSNNNGSTPLQVYLTDTNGKRHFLGDSGGGTGAAAFRSRLNERLAGH